MDKTGSSDIEVDDKCMISCHDDPISLYCETCGDLPICISCKPLHYYHHIRSYEDKKIHQLVKDFKSSIKEYKREIKFLKEGLEAVESSYNEAEISSRDNIKLVEEKFKILHQILQVEEINIKRRIKTIQDENTQQFIIKKSKVENKINILGHTINKFKTSNKDKHIQDPSINLQKHYIEINKFNHQINKMNKEVPSLKSIVRPFQFATLNFGNDDDLVNKFSEAIKDLIQVSSKYSISIKPLFKIPPSVRDLALGPGCIGVDTIPKKVISLTLKGVDGLVAGIIPPSVRNLYLCNIFNGELKEGVIPNGVEFLCLENVDSLVVRAIPPSVKELIIEGFSTQLYKGVIPEGVLSITLNSNSIDLKDISIPTSVETITLGEKIKTITTKIINNNFSTIKQVYLNNKRLYDSINIQQVSKSITIIYRENTQLDQHKVKSYK